MAGEAFKIPEELQDNDPRPMAGWFSDLFKEPANDDSNEAYLEQNAEKHRQDQIIVKALGAPGRFAVITYKEPGLGKVTVYGVIADVSVGRSQVTVRCACDRRPYHISFGNIVRKNGQPTIQKVDTLTEKQIKAAQKVSAKIDAFEIAEEAASKEARANGQAKYVNPVEPAGLLGRLQGKKFVPKK